MVIDFEHLRRWETEEAWEARARTRETRASSADMVLRCRGSLAADLEMIESDLRRSLVVEIEVVGRVNSDGLERSIFFFFDFSF